jgi:hypothetical protein
MNTDLRCGRNPCGNFTPLRFYEHPPSSSEIPLGCIRATVFTVLGLTECKKNGSSEKCLEFQTMSTGSNGVQWWWKTNEGEDRCKENKECWLYYNFQKQLLEKNIALHKEN